MTVTNSLMTSDPVPRDDYEYEYEYDMNNEHE